MRIMILFLFILTACSPEEPDADLKREQQIAVTTCLNVCLKGVKKMDSHYGHPICECV